MTTETTRNWMRENRERWNEYQRNWFKRNKDKVHDYELRRRMRSAVCRETMESAEAAGG